MRQISHLGAWPLAVLLGCIGGPVEAATVTLQEVRHWTVGEVTRVAVQLDGNTEVRRDRLTKPERYFFDFQGTSLRKRGLQTIAVKNSLVRQIRVGEARPGIARVVLDLVKDAEVSTTELANPYRLIIEVRPPGYTAPPPVPQPQISAAPKPEAVKTAKLRQTFMPPTRMPSAAVIANLSPAPTLGFLGKPRSISLPAAPPVRFPAYQARGPATSARRTETARSTAPVTLPPAIVPAGPPQRAQGARPATAGGNSMTRALGLKIRRVVIDPGHGGHDQGSSGPTGLLEKELVLDVALRLGELISTNLGSEVVFTRNDDHFVPLESRTQIANASKADLFISIHANSSPLRAVSGVETYFLSFTNSKEALDVAARENATSERSVFELRDLLQKIALQEKIDESRDFATKVNSALYRIWGNSGNTRNRGIKKAPFVVLIGASMPSILTEIGFLSNPRDERELRKPETRQKIAEGLYKGIAQYADSLSHFAVALHGTNED